MRPRETWEGSRGPLPNYQAGTSQKQLCAPLQTLPIRINELREAAQEAAGGEMHVYENPDTPPGISEQFWANVLQYEQAEETCHFLQLEQDGVNFPPPEALDDEQLTAKLWEVIRVLAKRNVFLSQTDHWSDRELYERLWRDTLREVTMDLPANFLSGRYNRKLWTR